VPGGTTLPTMKITLFAFTLVTALVGLCHVQTQTFTNADFEAGTLGFSSDYELADFNLAEGQFTKWPADPAWGLFTSSSMLTGSWKAVEKAPVTSGNVSIVRLPTNLPQGFFRLQRLP